MGGTVGKAVGENMKKTQEEFGKIQLERQIQMQNYMREQMMAMQVARARDVFHWLAAFYGTHIFFSIAVLKKRKTPAAMVPLFPLTFIVGYWGDMAYGNKMDRLRVEAEKICCEEFKLLDMPTGLPTIDYLDKRREESRK